MPESSTCSTQAGGTPSRSVIVAAISALLAAWVSAGSVGLLAGPLQSVLLWLLMLVAILTIHPTMSWKSITAGLLVLVFALITSSQHGGATLLVAATVSLLATVRRDVDRRVLSIVAFSIFALAVFRFAIESSALVWLACDRLGNALGDIVSRLTGYSLRIGATFAGLDFLVLMSLFTMGWLFSIRHRSWKNGLWAAGAVLGGHCIYLTILAMTPEVLRLFPVAAALPAGNPYVPPPLEWATIVRQVLPWNLPLIAAGIQCVVAMGMLRWADWKPASIDPIQTSETTRPKRGFWHLVPVYGPWCLAIALPIIGTSVFHRANLGGRTIIANERGQLDWFFPEHDSYGQQSAGVFGMLPLFAQSLGAQFYMTSDFSDEDLKAADVLLLLYPDRSLTREQQQRIWKYVRDGGALLVVADGYYPQQQQDDIITRLMEPSRITVRRDASISATGDWRQSSVWIHHPIADSRVQGNMPLLFDGGASMQLGWRGRPLIVGRWGWSAPQQGATWETGRPFDSGGKLGDLVLAAEQPFGRGTVMVLGNGIGWSNGHIATGWPVVGGTLDYLANRPSTAQDLWRQCILILCCLVLAGLLWLRSSPLLRAGVLFVFCGTLVACHGLNHHFLRSVPDGNWIAATEQQPGRANRLACIDASHLEKFSWQNWGYDSINGLALTLMRSDYLPIVTTEMTDEQLERAGMVVLLAPARRFSRHERAAYTRFVKRGGILIQMVGAEEAAASNSLLHTFQLHVPISPVPTEDPSVEPEPMGRLSAVYVGSQDSEQKNGDRSVSFFAAWPVESSGKEPIVLVTGKDGRPIVVRRDIGRGSVVLIGDTCFAMNKNLEYIGGEPFDGRHDNAQFWRWLISQLVDTSPWTPPPVSTENDSSPGDLPQGDSSSKEGGS